MTENTDIWADDKLERKPDADFLINFLLGRHEARKRVGTSGSYVLNVDAEWGFGKTFFMKRVAAQLSDKHPVVFIDAWKNDFSDDPYTTVISEIEAFFKEHIPKKDKETRTSKALTTVRQNAGRIMLAGAKGAVKQLAKRAIGEGLAEITEIVSESVDKDSSIAKAIGEASQKGLGKIEDELAEISDEMLDNFAKSKIEHYQEVKKSLENFKTSIEQLLLEFSDISPLQLPMFIFIDELDRCRPPYAIAMLERIKHLFDVPDIVFVLSTDTTQLANSISGVYGQTFASHRYLQRFFSRTFTLPKPTQKALIDALVIGNGVDVAKWHSIGVDDDKIQYLADASYHYEMSPRETKRSLEILEDLTMSWKRPFPIEISIMFPLIYGYVTGENIDQWDNESWFHQKTSRISSWKLSEVGNFGFRQSLRQYNKGNDYSLTLYQATQKDMRTFLDRNRPSRETVDQSTPSFIKLITYNIIETEYSKRFSNVVREGEFSDIRTYPNLIKHAGLLKA